MTDAKLNFEEPETFKPPALSNDWPIGLATEVALNDLSVGDTAIVSEDDLCKQFDLTLDELTRIKKHPAFRAQVREAISQVKEDGSTIKRKARIATEFYLDELVPKWISDPAASVDSKTKLLQFLAKLGGLDTDNKVSEAVKQAQLANQNNSPTIRIELTTGPSQQPQGFIINQPSEKVIPNE